MKKIISLLSIFAMIATMFTTVAFADDNNYFEWKEVDGQVTAESVTLKLHLTTAATSSVEIIGFSIKLPEELTAADITIKDGQFLKGLAVENGYLSYAATGVVPILTTMGEIATVTFNVKNLKNDFVLTCTPEGSNDGAPEASKDLYSMKPYTLKAPVVEEPEDKPVTMDTPVAGNDMYGMKTALTEITFKNVADPVVKLEKNGVDSGKTYELPAGVKGGETAIIGIIRYAADVTGTFALKVLDGTTEVASTTYVAE